MQDIASTLDDFPPDLGEQHLARCALDQGHAKFILQLHDLGGQRGLTDEAGLRGATEVLVLRERNQIAQIPQVDQSPLSLP